MPKLYTIRDEKADFFGNPFIARTDGEAIRSFTQACTQTDSPFAKAPADYVLYSVGSFNDSTGDLVSELPTRLISGDQVVTQQ